MADYVVEKILGKRFNKQTDTTEYLLQWMGYSQEESTWEPIHHLNNCPELLAEFKEERRRERKEKKRQQKEKRRRLNEGASTSTNDNAEYYEEPDCIIGLAIDKNNHDELQCFVKWKESNTIDPIPVYVVREKWPQVVIKFYEKLIKWY